MKPRPQISSISHDFAISDRFTTRSARKFPDIDFCFQETPPENPGFSGKGPRKFSAAGFHRLSSRYIARETNRYFVTDAVVFGVIVGVSAWPIISMIRAIGPLFRY
jgi:hypothetical protein